MSSNGLFYLFFITILVFSMVGHSEEVKKITQVASTDSLYLCKKDRVVRWLRSYKLEDGKCNTLYSKGGYVQIVGSATYYTSCENILNSVKKNLEEGGYVCSLTASHSVLDL